jgi:pyruvate/2-oxoglutarate dehydrogenase complex dihydrolipoamide dehydrogenase (E3) component
MQHDQSPPPSMLPDLDDLAMLDNAHPPGWDNPEPAGQYDFAILGAGPAGLVAARTAAALGAKVALIERHCIGGEVLKGCVPSKTIIRTSRLYAEMRDASDFGARQPSDVLVDFPQVMQHLRRTRVRLSRADSADRLRAAGIDVFFGKGRFAGLDAIDLDRTTLRFKKALIATGARPASASIPGLAKTGYLTNENVFDLIKCPPRLLVIGGGPLGCELAQAFSRLGARVILAQDEPMFLPGEERDAAQILSEALARDGIEIHLNSSVVRVRGEGGENRVDLVSDDNQATVAVDTILAGIGRAPNVESINLESAGVRYGAAGVVVNDFLQTTNANIYAAGDVCLQRKFAHAADATGRIVVENALRDGRKRLSGLTIPWCTYTDPEIAHVGLHVREARENGIPVKTFTILMHDVARAVADGDEVGFVKIHTREGTDEILGATIVASHAGEMINELSLAITSGIGLSALAHVIHTYPTQTEAFRLAAAAFERTLMPRTIPV